MNYMKILILSISLLFSFHLTDAMAYKYSFKNLTSKDVEINIQGVGVIGSWMMQGKMDPKGGFLGLGAKYKKSVNGKTTSINNAGHLKGKQTIKAGHTLSLNVNDVDSGICINVYEIFISVKGKAAEEHTSLLMKRTDFNKLKSNPTLGATNPELFTGNAIPRASALCGNNEFILQGYAVDSPNRFM